jgi:hypothetical protein
MKKTVLLLILVLSFNTFAQSPGGVSGSEIWCKVNKVTPTGTTFQYKDFGSNNKALTLGAGTVLTPSFFNYNYSFTYDNTDYISYLSKLEKLKEATIFIVNLPTPPSNPSTKYGLMNTDWNVTVPVGSINEQSFAFSTSTFEKEDVSITYPSGSSARPNGRINTLLWHNFNSKKIVNSFGSNGESSIFIGKSFTNTANFVGQIPEVIVYRKALNDKEKWRVESYLALKYGITLQPEVNYYTSKNEIFWHKENNGFFKNRIFGIGRDSNSSLYQRQSKSVHQDGNRLVLSRTNTLLPDNYPNPTSSNNITDQNFIVMGDNGRSELLNFDIINGITTMKKKWLVQKTGEEAHLFNTSLHYRPESPVTLGTNEAFWLIVDRNPSNTTESNFTGNTIEYYPVTSFDSNGYAIFTNLKWGDDVQKFNQYTFGKGPRMIVTATVDPLDSCDATDGKVLFDIKGGSPSFTITITGTQADGTLFNLILPPTSMHTFNYTLPLGIYQISVTDSTNFTTINSFTVAANPEVNINMNNVFNVYYLPNPTLIDASTFIQGDINNYSIKWYFNGSVFSNDNSVEIFYLYDTFGAGNYILEITNNITGCITSDTFSVIKDDTYASKSIVYPNPASSDEKFYVKIQFDEITEVTISILDALGKSFNTDILKGSNNYEPQYEIKTSGVYFIKIQSKDYSATHKIIIN